MRRQLVRLGRVASMTRAERADLVRAQWAIVVARLQLRTRPTGALVSARNGGGPGGAHDGGGAPSPGAGPRAADVERARALDGAVRRAAAHGPVATTCLVRATALQQLLEREGIQGSRLRVGVRRTGGRFAAHAWLELGDVVLGDQPRHVRTFTPTDLRLVPR